MNSYPIFNGEKPSDWHASFRKWISRKGGKRHKWQLYSWHVIKKSNYLHVILAKVDSCHKLANLIHRPVNHCLCLFRTSGGTRRHASRCSSSTLLIIITRWQHQINRTLQSLCLFQRMHSSIISGGQIQWGIGSFCACPFWFETTFIWRQAPLVVVIVVGAGIIVVVVICSSRSGCRRWAHHGKQGLRGGHVNQRELVGGGKLTQVEECGGRCWLQKSGVKWQVGEVAEKFMEKIKTRQFKSSKYYYFHATSHVSTNPRAWCSLTRLVMLITQSNRRLAQRSSSFWEDEEATCGLGLRWNPFVLQRLSKHQWTTFLKTKNMVAQRSTC